MARLKLKAQVRKEKGTGRVRKIRRGGVIPGVLYGRGQESIPLGVGQKELSTVLRSGAGEHAIVDLEVEGDGGEKTLKKTVIIKEVQHDRLRDVILHVDFAAISMTEKLVVKVPLVDVGIPAGIAQGGVLEQILREIEVECLPADVPDRIPVDVSALAIGDSIKVGDIQAPGGVRVTTGQDLTAFTVSVPKVEKVEAPVEEAAAEAAPAEGEEKAPEEAAEEEKKEEPAKEKGTKEKGKQ